METIEMIQKIEETPENAGFMDSKKLIAEWMAFKIFVKAHFLCCDVRTL